MKRPTSAKTFNEFMSLIWEGTLSPGPNGSTIITGHHLYHQFHDANKSADFLGFKFLYGAGAKTEANVWEAPDGSRLWIGTNGSWITGERRRNNLRSDRA